MMNLSDVLCPDHPLETGADQPLAPGDRVMLGRNHGPLFTVVFVDGDLAWIRPLTNGQEGLAPLRRLRRIEAAPAT